MNKILCALVFFTLSNISFSQWEPDVRLTTSGMAFTSYNNASCICAIGENVYIVWLDWRDGNPEIYFKKSTNNGSNWIADTRLTNNTATSSSPSMTALGSNVFIVWGDSRAGNREIFYKKSSDFGTTWSVDTRITFNGHVADDPSISVSGNTLNLAWHDNNEGNWAIYFKHSSDSGSTWSNTVRMTNIANVSVYPSITSTGSFIGIVWLDQRSNQNTIYYRRSTDYGASWNNESGLTSDTLFSRYPCISAQGSMVQIVWCDSRNNHMEIYYKRSSDGGNSWSPNTQLTNSLSSCTFPSIFTSGNNVHVVWCDYRNSNYEIYYKNSVNNGINWGTDIRLTNNNADSQYPFVTASGSYIHVIWEDVLNTTADIYYKRNATGNLNPPNEAPLLISPPNNSQGQSLTPLLNWDSVANSLSFRALVSIDSLFGTSLLDTTIGLSQVGVPAGKLLNNTKYFWKVCASNTAGNGPWSSVWNFTTALVGNIQYSSITPKIYQLYNNYPNPFNPATKIKFDIPKTSFVKISIFDISGRKVDELVSELLQPGTYETDWNASNNSSGVYFYRLQTENYSETKKLVLIK